MTWLRSSKVTMSLLIRAILHDFVVFASLIAAATRTTALRMGRFT